MLTLISVHETNGAWTYIAQFKKAEGLDRANIRFGNVNGQGGHEMIWLNKWNGDATVYRNNVSAPFVMLTILYITDGFDQRIAFLY